MVIKPINFQSSPNYSDPTFYLGMKAIPKVSSYIYLGIPFFFFSDDLLLLEYIISHITCIFFFFKVLENSFFHLTPFFLNKLIPIWYTRKKKVL